MASHVGRIGIFGGTFDPLHVGHLVAATWAREACGLDEVLVMVANDPWQKTGIRSVSPARVRLEAVVAATRDLDGVTASDLEIELGGETFTARTVEELRRRHPAAEFVLIVGTDTAQRIETWKSWDSLPGAVELAVVARAGEPQLVLGAHWNVRHVDIPSIEVSSTQLRERIATGLSVDYLVPSEALALYSREGLYS